MATKAPVAATDALKKLSRYCCAECGAKELFLYCWKGCRHVQSMKTFYLETRAVHHELGTLRETIYEQEIRLRDLEADLKEKQQSLAYLLAQVQKLPVQLHSSSSNDSSSTNDTLVRDSSLPPWASVGVQLLWSAFDADQDGELTDAEWTQLIDTLRAQHGDVDEVLGLHAHDTARVRRPETLLALYDAATRRSSGSAGGATSTSSSTSSSAHGGAAGLQRDLKALGIVFGSDEALANDVAQCSARLAQSARDTQALQAQSSKLQSEVHEKARAITRLRDAFASTAASLDTKDAEIARMAQQHEQAEAARRDARARADESLRKLVKAETDLLAATSAVVDMRALVEDQVTEKEKWQRYCWELETRVHDALHASKAQERDLWKTRDAKRAEARKSMLLYMDAHRGKRHFDTAPPAPAPVVAPAPAPVAPVVARPAPTAPGAQDDAAPAIALRSQHKALDVRGSEVAADLAV